MCGWNSLKASVDPYMQQRCGLLALPVLRVLCSDCFIYLSVSSKAELHMTHRQGQLIALRPCAAASQAQVLLNPQGKGRAATTQAARKRQTTTAVSYNSTDQGEFCCYLHKLKTDAHLRGGYPADMWTFVITPIKLMESSWSIWFSTFIILILATCLSRIH